MTDTAGMSSRPCQARLVLVLAFMAFASPSVGAESLRAPALLHPLDPPSAPLDPEAILGFPGSGVYSGSAEVQGPDGVWSVPFNHPANRQLHCAVYDAVRKRKIVFGGPNQSLDLIWTLSLKDRVQWSSFKVSGPVPANRYGATAIYDPPRDRVIMFGGLLGTYPNFVQSNEVWILSLSGIPAWTRLLSGAPPGRWKHTAIYDSARDRMVIYGGRGVVANLGDVWALDLAGVPIWTEIRSVTPSPPARSYHAATFDPIHDRMIVFGGEGPAYGYLRDTWELALSGEPAWRSIADPGAFRRAGHSLIYDPIGDRAVLLGGWGTSDGIHYGDLADVSILPAGQTGWTQVPYQSPYYLSYTAPAVYDADQHRIVGYNGRSAVNILALKLDDPINNYSPLLPTPVRRYGQTACYDVTRDRMLLYGGRSPDSPMGDTWELSLGVPVIWTMLSNDEGADREGHSAIYDPLRDRLIVYGGWGSTNEVWQQQLSGSHAWTPLATSGERSAVTVYHSAIYDQRRDRMIVFGGRVGHGPSLGDTWSLSLDGIPTWTRLPSGPGLSGHIAFYEPVGDRMLVLAGTRVWALSLAEPMAWSELVIQGGSPPPRGEVAALYDPIRNRIVIYGGCCFEDENYNAQSFADAWELSLDGAPKWRALATSAGPAGRNGASFVYDPLRDQGVLWGGVAPDKVWFEDTWTLRWGNPTKPTASCAQVVPESPLRLSYAVSNPLPATRSVEWSLASERALPGLPARGFFHVGGGKTDTVRLELPVPDKALDAPNTLTFACWFSGAAPNADTCRSLVPQRPKVVGLELVPHTLSLASKGRWVTGYLEPAPPLEAENIDIASIRLNGTATVDPAAQARIADHDRDGINDLMVRFSRDELERTVSGGDSVPVTVTGTLNGQPFIGRDFIRVLQPGNVSTGKEKDDDDPISSNEPSPKPAVAIRRVNVASGGRIEVELTLRDGSPARLELMDVAGRALPSRQVDAVGAGSHSFELAGGKSLPPGIYFLRLTQTGIEARTRVAILR